MLPKKFQNPQRKNSPYVWIVNNKQEYVQALGQPQAFATGVEINILLKTLGFLDINCIVLKSGMDPQIVVNKGFLDTKNISIVLFNSEKILSNEKKRTKRRKN